LILMVMLAWVAWIDHTARQAFEQHRWALPAQVYARPLELYAGLTLPPAALIDELQQLGYHEAATVTGPGQYSATSREITLHTRGFPFSDGVEPPHRARLHFDGRVLRTMDGGDAALPLLRLEPVEIARIAPRDQQDRILVQLADVPPALIEALLAVEDRNFYSHGGIDPLGILRALWVNLHSGEIRQGGSTITQQLIKNLFLGHERSYARKFNEVFMALALERRYGKDEILETYLNTVYLGQDGDRAIHGFALAAEFYFGRPLNELTAAQLALLAGLSRGASYYDPRRYPERALERRLTVLQAMVETGQLTPAAAAGEAQAPLAVTPRPLFRQARYTAFMDLVRRQLAQDYKEEDLHSAGLRIFTTLDPRTQSAAENAIQESLPALETVRERPRGSLQAAMLVAANDTGEVMALIGGRDPQYAGFNRVLDARRPIGSLIKPAVYLTALQRPAEYSVLTPLEDTPVVWEQGRTRWTPQNYDGVAHGDVPLYQALVHSYNLATVHLGLKLGVDAVIRQLRILGIAGEVPAYPALFLGAAPLSPFEVLQMYQCFAARGFRAPLRAIREVMDHDGRPLTRYGLHVEAVIKPEHVFLLNTLLAEVTRSGTAAALGQLSGGSYAGKTGTTNDLRDSWFAGFGRDLVAVSWVGRDDNAPTGLAGATGAMRLWAALMRDIAAASVDLTPPTGIEWRWVDAATGTVTDQDCAHAVPFPFIAGREASPRYQPCNAL
jgi:penicillin-binding protein 1B